MSSFVSHLQGALPTLRVSEEAPDRIAYARDLWPRFHLAVRDGAVAEHRPAAVCWPNTPEEVARVVRLCQQEGIPIVPYGAGSGVCGGVRPDERQVVLDLKGLKRWRHLDREQSTLDVEAGAMGIRLEEDLNDHGYTLGHFPSSILCSTVGGWVAARSAGQCSGKYGKIEDMVCDLECVTGTGELLRFRRRIAGPDLTPLVIGSEGILAVVTSARLRLHPAPATRTFASFGFRHVEDGWEAMRKMFQAGLRPAVSRLYDAFDSWMAKRGAVRGSRQKASDKSKAPGAGNLALRTILRSPQLLNRAIDAIGERVFGDAMLVLVFEGTQEEAHEDCERATAIARGLGADDLGEKPAQHWLAHRYSVSYRQAPVFMAGAFSDTMEVAAPWSRLGALYNNVRAALGRHVFVMAHLSHAYPDGCSIYFTFAGSAPTREASEKKYDETWRAALDAAIASGGTLSHHHGVGRSKAPRLGAELGTGIDLVHAVRDTFDPSTILNPGNLLPATRPARRAPAPPPDRPQISTTNMLVHCAGTHMLSEVQAVADAAGLSLGLALDTRRDQTIDEWIAAGTPGAPDRWHDPVDQTIAGFSAITKAGAALDVRPAPRRAVGPDIYSLFHGTEGRVGRVTSAHVRLHGPDRARALYTNFESNPAPDAAEQSWIDRTLTAASEVA